MAQKHLVTALQSATQQTGFPHITGASNSDFPRLALEALRPHLRSTAPVATDREATEKRLAQAADGSTTVRTVFTERWSTLRAAAKSHLRRLRNDDAGRDVWDRVQEASAEGLPIIEKMSAERQEDAIAEWLPTVTNLKVDAALASHLFGCANADTLAYVLNTRGCPMRAPCASRCARETACTCWCGALHCSDAIFLRTSVLQEWCGEGVPTRRPLAGLVVNAIAKELAKPDCGVITVEAEPRSASSSDDSDVDDPEAAAAGAEGGAPPGPAPTDGDSSGNDHIAAMEAALAAKEPRAEARAARAAKAKAKARAAKAKARAAKAAAVKAARAAARAAEANAVAAAGDEGADKATDKATDKGTGKKKRKGKGKGTGKRATPPDEARDSPVQPRTSKRPRTAAHV